MSGRRIRRHLTNIEDSSNSRRIVNFNYSENFKRKSEKVKGKGHKRKPWRLYWWSINQFDDSLVYALGMDETNINNDITT